MCSDRKYCVKNLQSVSMQWNGYHNEQVVSPTEEMKHAKRNQNSEEMNLELHAKHDAHSASSLDENKLIDIEVEDGDSISIIFPGTKTEIWHNFEVIEVTPNTDHQAHTAPSFKGNELLDITEIVPVPISFPEIKAEVGEDEWNFSTLKQEIILNEKYEDCLHNLEELAAPQNLAGCTNSIFDIGSQKKSDGNVDNGTSSSSSVSSGQESWKLRHHVTRTGEKIFEGKKRLSGKVNLAVQSSGDTGKTMYTCEVCTECFSSNHSFLRHCRIHTEQIMFRCDICNEGFYNKETFAIHLLVHSGTLSYSQWRKTMEM